MTKFNTGRGVFIIFHVKNQGGGDGGGGGIGKLYEMNKNLVNLDEN